MPIRLHHPVTGADYDAVTDAAAELWVSKGWVHADPDGPDEPFDVHTANVDELRAYATEQGIDLGGATRKAEIVEAITAAAPHTEEP